MPRPSRCPGCTGDPWHLLPASLRRLVVRLRRTDLRPGPVVDALFARLVAAAVALPGDHPAATCARVCADVCELCSLGESRLEAHWAELVAQDPGSLRAFPYLGNYVRLARGEHRALGRAATDRPRRLAFVGSGPLPLTALELRRLAPDLAITCLDRDAEALDRGRRVARSVCGDDGALRFVVADAADVDYGEFDVVVVAALVGATGSEKRVVLARMASTLRAGAVLAARSVPADGRRLLYPRLTDRDLPDDLSVVEEWRPPPGVINSLLVTRVRAGR